MHILKTPKTSDISGQSSRQNRHLSPHKFINHHQGLIYLLEVEDAKVNLRARTSAKSECPLMVNLLPYIVTQQGKCPISYSEFIIKYLL